MCRMGQWAARTDASIESREFLPNWRAVFAQKKIEYAGRCGVPSRNWLLSRTGAMERLKNVTKCFTR